MVQSPSQGQSIRREARIVRILMITDRYPPEARSAAILFQEMAESLAKKGHEVHVLTKMPTEYVPNREGKADEPWRKRVEHDSGVTINRVRGISSLSTSVIFRILQQLTLTIAFAAAAIRIPRPDTVIVYSPPLLVAVMAALYGRWRRIPYVLNLHDIYPRTAIQLGLLKSKLIIWCARRLEAFSYRTAAAIIVPAPSSQTVLNREYSVPYSKLHLIPNWVDTNAFPPGPRENAFRKAYGLNDQFVVSYAGLMGFAQDLTTVIDCARRLQGYEQCVFLLIGDGVCAERWKQMAIGLKNVRFLQMLPKSLYFDALRASDVCLAPLTEALASPAIPGKIQSIMSVGRPVVGIVPPSGDAANLILESQCGFVVSSGDVWKLQHIIEQFMDHPNIGEELGRNGRRYAEKHFTLEGAASSYERVLELVLEDKRNA